MNESSLRDRLCAAVTMMKYPRARKIVRPGLHKFLGRYWERNNRVGALREITLFSGDCMNIVLPEAVSEQLYTYGFFEEAVSTYALEHIHHGDVVFDIGAHFGYFSVLFSRLVGSTGRVCGFEPTPSSFRVLETNVASRGNVQAVNIALGAMAGTCHLKDYGLRLCGFNTLSEKSRMSQHQSEQKYEFASVSMTTIDQYVADSSIQPTFMKLDTENFEPQVLAGGMKTIRSCWPKIVLEAGSDSFLEAADMLVPMGYETYVTDGVSPISRWPGSVTDANNLYGNILFINRAETLSRSGSTNFARN